jgi:hypothetical protein
MRPNLPFVSAKHTLVTYNITLSLITKTNQGPRCFHAGMISGSFLDKQTRPKWYLVNLNSSWEGFYMNEPLKGINSIKQQQSVIGGDICCSK